MANAPYNQKRPESPHVRKALENNDINALKSALTFRQRRFCEEYIVDYNGAAAAVRAGYATKWADRQAGQLMMNEGITTYIDHLTASAAAKVMSVDPDYVIQGIVKIVGKEGGRDGDKLRGYELLARILGMMVEKKEITGKDGEAIKIQEVQEEADSFTQMLKALQKKDKQEVTIV